MSGAADLHGSGGGGAAVGAGSSGQPTALLLLLPSSLLPVLTCPCPLTSPPKPAILLRGAIKEKDAGVEEVMLAEKIIAHLIKREQVLLVVDQPIRGEGEAAIDFAKRLQSDRVLSLNPNYSAE